MALSWSEQVRCFKSPVRVTAAFLLRSRALLAEKCGRRTRERNELKQELERAQARIEQDAQTIAALQRQVFELKLKAAAPQPFRLPDDPKIPLHSYGPRKVALACNLAREIGFRPAETVMNMLFEWLDVEDQAPDWTTIRGWMQRLGVAAMTAPWEEADDWVWMVDHSNQIGQEKILVVIAIRASRMPPPGETIKHEDMHVLTVQPGVCWNREAVSQAYAELAAKYGAPMAVVSDGAVELRDPVEILQKIRPDCLSLGDFKHFAANEFKRQIGNSELFLEFSSKVGATRSAIQQTELAHLTPPSVKQKARFMNMAATLKWAAMTLWLLNAPGADVRKWFTPERLEAKLGWLRSFQTEIVMWRECQTVISKCLTFLNQHGVYRGAMNDLFQEIANDLTFDTTRNLARNLLLYVHRHESLLPKCQRLPLSTEILESSFALYKQLERQHSKGGFTSLVAAFGALQHPTTPSEVRAAFKAVPTKVKDQWVAENLPKTLNAKRRQTQAEYKKSKISATNAAIAT